MRTGNRLVIVCINVLLGKYRDPIARKMRLIRIFAVLNMVSLTAPELRSAMRCQ